MAGETRKQSWRRRWTGIASIGGFVGFVVSGCGVGGNGPGLVEAIQTRHASAASVRPFDSLDDLLSNREYQLADGSPAPLTEAVVTGEFVEVRHGRGFLVDGRDAPGGTVTQFDDPHAVWRTVHGRFRVGSVVSGRLDAPTIEVGFAFGADVETGQLEQDLKKLGQVLLFLNRSAVFSYAPEVYGTLMDGALLATVGPDGRITLPVLDQEERRELLAGAGTVDELRQAARLPVRLVRLDPSGAAVLP